MERVLLVHWKEEEGRERVRELRRTGLRVELESDGVAALRAAKEDPPDAVLIDLTRLPSHGRALAWALRQLRATRRVPLVFAGGDAAKVARLRGELPDAHYVSWPEAAATLARAALAPSAAPVVPRHVPSAKPLAAKLGLKPGGRIALVGAPEGFELGPLPEGARCVGPRARAELVLWFVRSVKELRAALPRWKTAAARGVRVWVAWPKKGSTVATDLTQDVVRRTPHAHGLVDYKICALDGDWSGMCFAARRGRKP